MRIRQATIADVEGLARLLWLDTLAEDPDPGSVTAFATDLTTWWAGHQDTHFGFIAQHGEQDIVGMAWVALLARIPRPGATCRACADIQTVYVEPQHRGRGIDSALVNAAAGHAEHAGAVRVTVHSGRAAVAMYERLGFASTRQLLQRTHR
ncbi:MAG: GNAT family N-acetyltransferase [Actinomycetales bacterium]|nr:GNAT family N-acetyltransferase [Actinomycetales bacterium]